MTMSLGEKVRVALTPDEWTRLREFMRDAGALYREMSGHIERNDFESFMLASKRFPDGAGFEALQLMFKAMAAAKGEDFAEQAREEMVAAVNYKPGGAS